MGETTGDSFDAVVEIELRITQDTEYSIVDEIKSVTVEGEPSELLAEHVEDEYWPIDLDEYTGENSGGDDE